MLLIPAQKWCGQTQPHAPHLWADPNGGIGLSRQCAGYSEAARADTEEGK